jgi:hypothetical protein
MVTTFLEIGGIKRPIRFAYEGLLAYEQKTKRNAIEDFAKFETDNVSVTFIVNITYAGLYAGYRKEGIAIDFDEFDVAGWIGESEEVINSVLEIFVTSFPANEKKMKPPAAKAKARI